jgi:hypothetical protein
VTARRPVGDHWLYDQSRISAGSAFLVVLQNGAQATRDVAGDDNVILGGRRERL